MFIEKEKWDNLVKEVNTLYSNYDSFGDNLKNLVDNVDICVDDIKESLSNKIYVITNNAVVDGEIDYQIAGVSTNKKKAQEIFKEAIRNAKIDADFDNLDAIDGNKCEDVGEAEWCYEEDKDSFSLYLNGEYSSNNFSIRILEFDIDNSKEKEQCL